MRKLTAACGAPCRSGEPGDAPELPRNGDPGDSLALPRSDDAGDPPELLVCVLLL